MAKQNQITNSSAATAGAIAGLDANDEEFDFFYDYAKAAENRSEAWTEENWESEMDKHPLFISQNPEPGKESALVEAMAQLKYDPEFNSPLELMISYKNDGNENFRIKKYRWAIEAYSEGVRIARRELTKPETLIPLETRVAIIKMVSTLYNNRASAHFYLENYRTATKDARLAASLDPTNQKAYIRVLRCLESLRKYSEVIDYCNELLNDPKLAKPDNKTKEELQKALKSSSIELKKAQRDERKAKLAQDQIDKMQSKILEAVKLRKIAYQGSLFESNHGSVVHGHLVHLDDNQNLIWPVVFVYPEYGQTDFIQSFHEHSTFISMLEEMFSECPEWDVKQRYRPQSLRMWYHSYEDERYSGLILNEISTTCTLEQALKSKGYVACIKPVELYPENKDGTTDDEGDAGIKINRSQGWKNRRNKNETIQQKVHEPEKPKQLSVTLGDCLACSGCITSAEEVLIAEQSDTKVFEILELKKNSPNDLIIVLSLSLQSIASIAAKYCVSMQQAAERLSYFFHQLGVDYVLDITIARQIALIESAREYINSRQEVVNNEKLHGPIISSTCPGFVCYAEKSQGTILVPMLSRVKSPQQIMGLLVKKRFDLLNNSKECIDPVKIYHITLMPCYDKKLEASRLDNRMSSDNLTGSIPEVDCVITPIEVEKMFQLKHVNFNNLPSRPLNYLYEKFNMQANGNLELRSHSGSGAGGYAENIFRFIASEFYGKQLESCKGESPKLHWKAVRNNDYLELKLYENGSTDTNVGDKSMKSLLSFAILNGFRNVQNLVSRVKRKTCSYDYVEVSACPKGCLNGGAQIRDIPFNPSINKTKNVDASTIAFEQVEHLYENLSIEPNFGLEIPISTLEQIHNDNRDLYESLRLNEPEILNQMRTEFKVVEKTFNILNSNW